MLSALPVEILLEVIQCLPFSTIASLSTLSRPWTAFMDMNESSIYHGISKRYGYVDSSTAAPPEGWKAWFIHKYQVELRWIGKLPGHPHRVTLPGRRKSVYKIKVDEEAGYVITTFTDGGLVVSDIHDHRVLWALHEVFCGPMAHCEHDKGYIVFDRPDNYKEVWRRRIDVLNIPEEAWPSEVHNKPDDYMFDARLFAQARYLDASRMRDPDHLHGQFTPWARLLIPEDLDDEVAFRLSRGTLLAFNADKVFLYDIEKAELEQIIETRVPGRVEYIDVSEQHVFIVSHIQLTVYDRVSGLPVLDIPSGRLPWDFYASPENQWRRTEEASDHGELGFRRAVPPNWAHRMDYFDAAHVSSCGKHLAIMATSNRVILVQDFWRLLAPSEITLRQISKQIDFYTERPSLPLETMSCLAYDNGKVAIFGAYGVFVLVLDSILDQLGGVNLLPKDVSLQILPRSSPEYKPSWPNLRLRQVVFNDLEVRGLDIISCLQLTETKLYLSVISEDPMNERFENMRCYDFASPPPASSVKSPPIICRPHRSQQL